jgi:N-acetyl-D-muramate 6-phosphate phosphatase
MKATTQAVLFDLDGTLVDTAADLGNAANHVRASLGMPPLPLPAYRQFASAGARGLLRIALEITPEHADYAQFRARFLEHYRDNLSRHSRLFDGIGALLDALEARGIRWGVVTNKPRIYTEALLKDLSLSPRAAVAISADDAAKAKPHPDTLLLACERLQLPAATCVYVGDDKRDADAAIAARMRFIAVAWGYEGEHPVASWNADATIDQPLDLLEHL